MSTLIGEKVDQAVAILDELEIDAWLTFVRETTEAGDPILPIILGHPLTWQSALIITRAGDRIAVVGHYEDEAVRSTGAWSEIVPYVEGIRDPLRQTLERLDPRQLAVNFSRSDVKADGLSHGLYLVLLDHLAGTPYADRLVSAEGIVSAVRGRKTGAELARLRSAIDTTNDVFVAMAEHATPGASEASIARFMRERAGALGAGLAWDEGQCPIVTTGPASMVGHGIPSEDLTITAGGIFHVDFGVRLESYCSDVQRVWYVPEAGEDAPPASVTRAFDTVVRAIDAAAAQLAPGARGCDVDAAARRVIVEAGYPEYRHATGHQVGRAAHDGGAVLGPEWERYGETPRIPAEAGNVFTLELGIENVDDRRGYLGLEEMVVVTPDGCEYLTAPQRTLPTLGGVGGGPAGRLC